MIQFIFSMMNAIFPFEWLQPEFMKRALMALLCVAPACAAMGVLVVNFRMAFFSDAISHSAFTGVAIGLLLGVNPMVTLILFGVLVGIGITQLRRRSDLPMDTIIGVFFSGAVSLGIVIISHERALARALEAFLYGDVLAVSGGELLTMFVLLLLVLAFVGYSYNELFLIGLNEELSLTRGIKVGIYNFTFGILLALVVTVSIRAIGILLVTAMLIVPAATARNMARSAGSMFWYSIGAGLIAAVSGLVASYKLDTATGATVILFATILFALTYPLRAVLRRG